MNFDELFGRRICFGGVLPSNYLIVETTHTVMHLQKIKSDWFDRLIKKIPRLFFNRNTRFLHCIFLHS